MPPDPLTLTEEECDSLADFYGVCLDIQRDVRDLTRAAFALGAERQRERDAGIARSVKGGFTANIRVDESEQEMIRDPDGPWVLNSDVAAAIERGGEGEEK